MSVKRSHIGLLMVLAMSPCAFLNGDPAGQGKPAQPGQTGQPAQPTEPARPAQPGKPAKPDAPKVDPVEEAAKLRLAVRRLFGDLTFAFTMGQRFRIQQLLFELNKVAPNSAENQYFQGLAAYRDGDRIKAVMWMRKAVESNPDFDPAWNMLGLTLLDAERYEEAVSAFLKAEAANGFDPHYPYNVASAFYSLKKYQQCVERATRAFELKKNFSEAAYLKALCMLEDGDAQGSLAAFETALKDGKKSAEWSADYLRAAERTGHDALIVKILETGLDDHPAVWRALSSVYMRYGDYEKAFRFLDRLLRSNVVVISDRLEFVHCARRLGIDPRAAWMGVSEADRRVLDEWDRVILGRRTFGGKDGLMNPVK